MMYREIKPNILLQDYIDSYWIVKTDLVITKSNKLMPDGCIDIILNIGADLPAENDGHSMKNKTATLVGTMTIFKNTTVQENTHLIGIRFKPLGFSAFYEYDSLDTIANTSIGFEKKLVPDIYSNPSQAIAILDHFFLNRLSQKNNPLSKVLNDIKHKNGIITVDKLAKNNYISNRQLERSFNQYIGVSPKEYLNFVRYQYALEMIRKQFGKASLLDIAFETGFYDHSHLTNQIKKRTGLPPSQLLYS